MSFAFRHFAAAFCALLVLMCGVQSAFDTPHDPASATAVHDLATPDADGADDDPADIDHEHSAGDHAMIPAQGLPVTASGARKNAPAAAPAGLRKGGGESNLLRPPRVA